MFWGSIWSHYFDIFKKKQRVLYIATGMIFFWAIYDGIISFVTPSLMEDQGFSKMKIGLIIASSSIAGAVFDFVITKFLKRINYIRLFLSMFVLCFSYPLLLWSANRVWLFVVCMAIWGLYYDIFNFGLFDLLSDISKDNEHCQGSGIVAVFESFGYLVAPIIASILIANQKINSELLVYTFIFLIGAGLFYVILTIVSSANDFNQERKIKKKNNWIKELILWKKIGFILYPVLIFNLLIYVYDGVFWTLGPIFVGNFAKFGDFNGLLMTAYGLPILLTGWYVEKLTSKFGKKRTAYVSFLISSWLLISIGFIKDPYILLLVSFLSSAASSIARPAIRSAYIDYINESENYQSEIEGLNDLTMNMGYIVGPIFAGFMADKIGIGFSFSVLGGINLLIVILLFLITPKNIRVVVMLK